MNYAYDKVGNITSITDILATPQAQTQTFTYDALDRLKSANVTGGTNGLYNELYDYNTTTGNLETKGALTLTYPSQPSMTCTNNRANPAHGVNAAGGNVYEYDCNGNMARRDINSGALMGDYTLSYDAENRLVSVSGAVTASFVYDGDGNRVKSTINGVTTTFVGNWYEVTGSMVTKYYYAGSQRVAMRTGSTLYYLLGDHLGSTSITTDRNGALVSELRYKPWGETRYSSGTTPTQYQFTGQRNETSLGLYFYNARWYDDALGRFNQPDTIIPQSQGVQAWDRFAYSNNNPLRYTDPTGHFSRDEIISFFGVDSWSKVLVIFDNGRLKDRWGWLMVLQHAEIGDEISITMDDMTITGNFDLDLNGNLIVTVDDHNYYIDQEKVALLGDSYELTKEMDLSEFFCSPYTCTIEYYNYETDGVIPVPPYMNNPHQNKYLSNPNDKTILEWLGDQFTDYDPETHEAPLPSGGHGGGGGVLPADIFLLD